MKETDLEPAVALISVSMNQQEAQWARETMEFHFKCKKQELDTGRKYYVWRHKGEIHGLVGLHRYLWGPLENVWLSWFAVHPSHHRKGVGSALIEAIEKQARNAGYKKLFIETYDNPTFEKARNFYKARGFSQTGSIKDYLPDGSAMIIFSKRLIQD
ncbi:MAG: GNAT family N-acetyltransferase [Planctomycetota bacterium]